MSLFEKYHTVEYEYLFGDNILILNQSCTETKHSEKYLYFCFVVSSEQWL